MNIINNGLKILMIFYWKNGQGKLTFPFSGVSFVRCVYTGAGVGTLGAGGLWETFQGLLQLPGAVIRHILQALFCAGGVAQTLVGRRRYRTLHVGDCSDKVKLTKKAALVNSSDNSTQKQQKFLIAFSLK